MAKLLRSFVFAMLGVSIVGQASSPDRDPRILEVQIDQGKLCIDLTLRGVEANKVLEHSAVTDSRSSGKDISFYKALPVSKGGEIYYVFYFENYSDVYIVYVANKSQTALVRKFMYGTLNYPCPIPHDEA